MCVEHQETEEQFLGNRAALQGLDGLRNTSDEALGLSRGHINEGPCGS